MSHAPARPRRGASAGWLLAAGVAALAAAALVSVALRWQHRAGYRGVCGPHATDSAAHPCTREDHDREFGAGFAGLALVTYRGTAALLALLAVDAVRRARTRSSRGPETERAT